MMEPTLSDHMDGLRAAVEDYRASVRKMQEHFAFEVEALWKDQADLRDEVNTNVAGLSNRLEALTRAVRP
jgi:hypothetical protein